MGACENQLYENETKESLIKLYIELLDENRELKAQIQRTINYINALGESTHVLSDNESKPKAVPE